MDEGKGYVRFVAFAIIFQLMKITFPILMKNFSVTLQEWQSWCSKEVSALPSKLSINKSRQTWSSSGTWPTLDHADQIKASLGIISGLVTHGIITPSLVVVVLPYSAIHSTPSCSRMISLALNGPHKPFDMSLEMLRQPICVEDWLEEMPTPWTPMIYSFGSGINHFCSVWSRY